MFRQGDVLLIPVDEAPGARAMLTRADLRPKGVKAGVGLVLAAGEATGHHHAIKDRNARAFRSGGDLFVTVGQKGATLQHEEHASIPLPQGTYRVVRAREHVPPPEPRRNERTFARTEYVYD